MSRSTTSKHTRTAGIPNDRLNPVASQASSNLTSSRQSRIGIQSHYKRTASITKRANVQSAPQTNPPFIDPRLMMSAKEGEMMTNSQLVTCKYCNRKFFNHRINTHEAICKNISLAPPRKPFDSAAMRLRGTEAEPFAKNAEPVQRPVSNWKRNHQDLIQAIRTAKRVHASMSKQRNKSSSHPSSNSQMESITIYTPPQFITCPHCGRRFSEKTADRHVEICEKASLATKRWK